MPPAIHAAQDALGDEIAQDEGTEPMERSCALCGELRPIGVADCIGCEDEPWEQGPEAYFRAWTSAWLDGTITSSGAPR